jgi:uncharacterized protein (TIGR03435 family)
MRSSGANKLRRKIFLTASGAIAFALLIVLGLSPVMGLSPATSGQAQASKDAAKPQFDVASVKPCDSHSLPPDGGRGGRMFDSSSGSLTMTCVTVKSLILMAYVLNANGERHVAASLRTLPIEGGPAWADSERYTVDAKTESQASSYVLRGPMLQAVLEDRFKLKIHHETREIPVYELTVAKGGFKLQPAAEGSCTVRDPANPRRALQPGEKPFCGQGFVGRKGQDFTVDLRSMTLAELANWLNFGMDRIVFDKTGITGKYDFHLEFSIDESTPGFSPGGAGENSDEPGQFPSMFSVMQQFGLKLVPAKGPGNFLVIDSVARPTGN